ncbi:MAG: hypothetical protein P4M11_11910, partial [Candidatus Pacebacteria bacterium]|nr:hypothetical protein [Candidatus Paceibacterota bacterium]
MISGDVEGEGDDGAEDEAESVVREKLRFYERKVLQAETERIEKEKENLVLKSAIMNLQLQLREQDQGKDKEREYGPGSRIRFEGPPAAVLRSVVIIFYRSRQCAGWGRAALLCKPEHRIELNHAYYHFAIHADGDIVPEGMTR